MLRQRLGVREIQPDAARDPDVMRFAQAVRVIVDEGMTDAASMASEVALTTKSGVLRRRVTDLPGTPENPMSEADVRAKFLECTALGVSPLSPAQANALAARVASLEDTADMARFFSGMVGASAPAQRSA